MPTPPRSLRLIFKDDDAPIGRHDGAWWPRSSDPATELPVLIRALVPRLGLVRRIGYNPDAWGALPSRLAVDGNVVRLEGFPGMDRHTLRITGMITGVLVVLVVPPTADEYAGNAALTAALTQNGYARDILAASGVVPAGGVPAQR